MEKIKREPFFVWPPKLLGNPALRDGKLYCTYHKDTGHMTENCHMLKVYLEKLVSTGHLDQYVDADLSSMREPCQVVRQPHSSSVPSAGVIHVIHNRLCSAIFSGSYRSMIQKATHLRRSFSVIDSVHPAPMYTVSGGGMEQVISFSNSDLRDVQLPHNDPLVITLRIGNYDVKRVLVDQGSFAEVMYQDLYMKLDLGEAELSSFTSPIFGFSGEPTVPLGKTILPVLAGPINLQTEFIVLKASSPYNAIMGRNWLHRMRAIPSTLHQKLRFPTKDGIMELNGDQVTAKQSNLLENGHQNVRAHDREDGWGLYRRYAHQESPRGKSCSRPATGTMPDWYGCCSWPFYFKGIKTYLSTPLCLSIPNPGEPLFLYLAVSNHAVSAVLVWELGQEQKSVFFVSKAMDETELRYLPLEKVALALLQAVKKLPHYFQSSTITVLSDLPLKMLLQRSDFSGRITRWGYDLSNPSMLMPAETQLGLITGKWELFVDGVSNSKGLGAGIVLVSTEGLILKQPARELNPLSSPWPFAQWGLDIVGPLPRAPGNKRFLTVATDYFTKWVEAEPLSNIRDVDAKRFLWKNVITRFGIPWAAISDNGTQFESRLFKGFCSELAAKGKWVEELPSVLWTHTTIIRKSIDETPFALAFGVEAVIPLEVGLPTTRTTEFVVETNKEDLWKDLDLLEERRDLAVVRLASYQQRIKREHDKNIKPRVFRIGELVLRKVMANIRKPNEGKLRPNWEGPYKVLSQAGHGAFRLEDMDGKPVPRPWNI
uniref:Integrase catalytic domain-containing protein n=1 Tax=Fagus sylvatica TaxID=28930 RepID=A0A2N9FJ42_FAGSY